MLKEFSLTTSARTAMILITREVQHVVGESGVQEGMCTVFVPHTTAGVTINENADPSVRADILAHLNKLVPHDGEYRHEEGNADAHIKAVLVGSSVRVPVQGGRLCLGPWQGIFFCEFDGPRTRRVNVMVEG